MYNYTKSLKYVSRFGSNYVVVQIGPTFLILRCAREEKVAFHIRRPNNVVTLVIRMQILGLHQAATAGTCQLHSSSSCDLFDVAL